MTGKLGAIHHSRSPLMVANRERSVRRQRETPGQSLDGPSLECCRNCRRMTSSRLLEELLDHPSGLDAEGLASTSPSWDVQRDELLAAENKLRFFLRKPTIPLFLPPSPRLINFPLSTLPPIFFPPLPLSNYNALPSPSPLFMPG